MFKKTIPVHDVALMHMLLEMPYVPLLFVNQLVMQEDPSWFRPLVSLHFINKTKNPLELDVTATACVDGYSSVFKTNKPIKFKAPNAPTSTPADDPRKDPSKMVLAPVFGLDSFYKVDEITRATVEVEILIKFPKSDLETLPIERSIPITILPPATLFLDDPNDPQEEGGSGTVDPTRWRPDPIFLASLVTPNDPDVQRLALRAADIHQNRRLLGALPALSYEAIVSQVAACFQAVQELDLRYVVPPFDVLPPATGQHKPRECARIRLPRDVIRERLVECVGAALLLASVLEATSQVPYLITFVRYKDRDCKHPISSHILLGFGAKAPQKNSGTAKELRKLDSNWLVTDGKLKHDPNKDKAWVVDFVEPTMIVPGYSFQEARQRAREYIDYMKSLPNQDRIKVHAIQLYAARSLRLYPMSSTGRTPPGSLKPMAEV